jgi:hypothetical protein
MGAKETLLNYHKTFQNVREKTGNRAFFGGYLPHRREGRPYFDKRGTVPGKRSHHPVERLKGFTCPSA